jgi:putative transposase
MMARREPPKGRPASKGYREAKKVVSEVSGQVARRRRDDARKWAKGVVRHHHRIVVEDFRPKFLAKSTMAKKPADGAIGRAKRELFWMAAKHERDRWLVDPAPTEMDCGARVKHRLPLSERTYLRIL